MTDSIVRTAVQVDDDNIIRKQVMNKTDDNIIRHQVMGIEESTPTIESLSVTENGTYNVTEGVDGFNPVVVNVPEPTPKNIIISKIKVVTEDETEVIKDVARDFVLTSNNAINITNHNIDFGADQNCYLNCQVTQMNIIPYVIECDIKRCIFNTDTESSKYYGIFTFGRNKSTLWGLFFDSSITAEEGKGTLKFRPQTNINTYSEPIAPESLENKTLKLYLNCGLDNNNNIIYEKNNALIYSDNTLLINGGFANYSGQGWDQMCSMGWSSYSWGCDGLIISEYRVKQLSELMEV